MAETMLINPRVVEIANRQVPVRSSSPMAASENNAEGGTRIGVLVASNARTMTSTEASAEDERCPIGILRAGFVERD